MTGKLAALRRRGLLLVALALQTPSAWAQPSLGVDVQVADRYMWRGITRSQTWVAQPSILGSWFFPCLETSMLGVSVSAGAWANWQIARAGASELSDLAPGRRGISEVDLWLEGAAHHDLFDFAAGVVRYIYPATDSGALRTRTDNTTELYARLRLPRVPWVKPSLVTWVDVARVKGVYIEASATTGLKLFPTGANLDVGATAGLSLGQERMVTRPFQGFNSERPGLTYLELVLGPSVGLGPVRIAVDWHPQWSFDDLTRRASRTPGLTRVFFHWWTVSAGYTWQRAR